MTAVQAPLVSGLSLAAEAADLAARIGMLEGRWFDVLDTASHLPVDERAEFEDRVAGLFPAFPRDYEEAF